MFGHNTSVILHGGTDVDTDGAVQLTTSAGRAELTSGCIGGRCYYVG